MIKFNRPVRTKDGQEVVPFLMEGKKVYCFDGAKNTVIKYLSDFDFTPKIEEKKVVSVIPIATEKEVITVVPTVEATDEFHEIKEEIKTEPEPVVEPEPVISDDDYFGDNDESYI